MRKRQVNKTVDRVETYAVAWSLRQVADMLTLMVRYPEISEDELYDRFFEPPVYTLNVDATTQRMVINSLRSLKEALRCTPR